MIGNSAWDLLVGILSPFPHRQLTMDDGQS